MGKKKKPKKKRCSSPRKHQTESFVLCFSSRTWFGFLQNRYPLTIHIICAFCIAPHAKHWLGKPRLELKERAFLWEKSPVRQKSTEKLFCPFILVHLFCYHHTHYFLGKKVDYKIVQLRTSIFLTIQYKRPWTASPVPITVRWQNYWTF